MASWQWLFSNLKCMSDKNKIWTVQMLTIKTTTHATVTAAVMIPLIFLFWLIKHEIKQIFPSYLNCAWKLIIQMGLYMAFRWVTIEWSIKKATIFSWSFLGIKADRHETTRKTRTPAFWDSLRRPMITHTSDSHQIPNQNKMKSKLKFKKKMPKIQILKFCKKLETQHTFCLIRCINMKWIQPEL